MEEQRLRLRMPKEIKAWHIYKCFHHSGLFLQCLECFAIPVAFNRRYGHFVPSSIQSLMDALKSQKDSNCTKSVFKRCIRFYYLVLNNVVVCLHKIYYMDKILGLQNSDFMSLLHAWSFC